MPRLNKIQEENLVIDYTVHKIGGLDLSKKYNINETTVYDALRRNNIILQRDKDILKSRNINICNSYKEGLTIHAISQKYNISITTTRDVLTNKNLFKPKKIAVIDNATRLSIVNDFISITQNTSELAKKYNISPTTVCNILHNNGFKTNFYKTCAKKYDINETFFDNINTEEKAYILGLLYADGYNNESRNSVNLSLAETDKNILDKITLLIQPTKPLQFVEIQKNNPKKQNQYRLVIANKHISQQLVKLGCMQAKTFKITFPEWLQDDLIPHFIRGYCDGDGYINKNFHNPSFSITGTEIFCNKLAEILKEKCNINSSLYTRHKERNHNIRTLTTNGRQQVVRFLEYVYKNANIFLDRKMELANNILNYTL
jgi:Mor family transcriptional regulator